MARRGRVRNQISRSEVNVRLHALHANQALHARGPRAPPHHQPTSTMADAWSTKPGERPNKPDVAAIIREAQNSTEVCARTTFLLIVLTPLTH